MSIEKINSRGERADPWWTPTVMLKGGDVPAGHMTMLEVLWYSSWTHFTYSSGTPWSLRSARKVALWSPRVFQTSVGISSGPVALHLFIFSMASFTSAVVIQGTGPRVGGGLGIGGCGNSSLQMPEKYSDHR